VVGGARRVLPTRLFARVPPVDPPAGFLVRVCTLRGPRWPVLWSARAGRSSIPGVREVGVRIESVWWWGCAPVSSRAPAAPASLPPPFSLLSPLPRILFSLSTRLAISPLPVSSIPPHPLRAIRLVREWCPRWSQRVLAGLSLTGRSPGVVLRGWAWVVARLAS
jgi:hypothetical protein